MVDKNTTKLIARQHIIDRARPNADGSKYNAIFKSPVEGGGLWAAMLFAYGHRAHTELSRAGLNTKARERITPALAVALGLPFDHQLNGVKYLQREALHRSSSLMNIISGFLEMGDKEQEEQAFYLYEQVQSSESKWRNCAVDTSHNDFHSHSNGWWNPTRPEDYGLKPLHFDGKTLLFDILQLGWYDDASVRTLIEKGCNGHYNNILNINLMNKFLGGRWDEPITRVAENLIRNYSKNQVEYVKLAEWLQLVSPRFFQKWIARQTGVRQALAVVRPDAPDGTFGRGLRLLGTNERIGGFLGPLVARPLTWADVSRTDTKGVIDLLWRLPWKVVEPLVSSEKTKIHNKLLGLADRPDLINKAKEMFKDHPERQVVKDVATEAPHGTSLWHTQMTKVVARHAVARDYRRLVLDQTCMDPHRLFLIARYMLASPVIKKRLVYMDTLRALPEGEVIEELMMRFPAHLLPGFEDKLSGLPHIEAAG